MSVTELPLVSVVTPCLNAVRYIEETIQSVLAQDYPHVEYLVVDGGSTDGTLGLVAKYRDRLRCHSGPDRGVADGVNRGFRLSSGSIFAWLSADDVWLPGAVSKAVGAMLEQPEQAAVYGDAAWVDRDGGLLGNYPTQPFDAALLARQCFISQPAAFLRSEVFAEVGMLDPELRYTFDYELWMRIARIHSMRKIDGRLALARMRRDNISLGQRRQVFEETMAILSRHYGYVPFSWVYSYACYRIDGRDQFFEPLQPSAGKFLLSLPMGLRRNPRHPFRFLAEWAGQMSLGGLGRLWKKTAP